MNKLLNNIENIKKSRIEKRVNNRIKEFKEFKNKDNNSLFKELCFCLLTANYSAEGGIKVQCEIGEGFITLTEKELSTKLKKCGYRFPNVRAKYIAAARNNKDNLKEILNEFSDNELREWFVKNIKGLGYKEASHFLRNIGFDDYAIIDFHIIDLLVKYNLIKRPKTISKIKYLEIEDLLRKIAEASNLTLAELDLYLWCMETGKVLK
ncbi:N-glycosylase/DNA lyase [Candidatus Woesearchaeota archaeon]|nr:N-glycosylase/DNA lyase [Candidatus Woesearchaeota archaeon]